MRAELHADGGAAAATGEFFRAGEFLRAEKITHTLEAGPLLLPVLVREIPGAPGALDAISPYGYPGATMAGASVEAGSVDWEATGLVSLFVRDRIRAEPAFAGGTERSPVQVHDPSIERSIRPRLLEQVRSNERGGWTVTLSPGPESTESDRGAFHSLYTQTMHRTGAGERYLFAPEYFDGILGFERSWLLTAAAGGTPGAGAIAAVSDGVLHYYLGGSADSALDASPFKNVVVAMLDLADELGLPLNLGGGLIPGDGLERFKRGFANAEAPFVTHEIVCDRAEYARLAAGRDEVGAFFPAYRAP
ncbi:MAG: GNAT family N-acetyltransferase [Solirubrobacterales bacterium]